MGLTSFFSACEDDSGLRINNYKMDRYIQGYNGIIKMLDSVGGKLLFKMQSDGETFDSGASR